MVYSDSSPAASDLGKGEYSKKMFSPARHEILAACSLNHSTPGKNGKGQDTMSGLRIGKFGQDGEDNSTAMNPAEEQRAKEVSNYTKDGISVLKMELKDVHPEDRQIIYWKRKFVFNHEMREILVEDDFRLSEVKEKTFVWMICANRPFEDGCRVIIPVSGGRDVDVVYEGLVRLSIEEVDLSQDKVLAEVWGDIVWRIALVAVDGVGDGRIERGQIFSGGVVEV